MKSEQPKWHREAVTQSTCEESDESHDRTQNDVRWEGGGPAAGERQRAQGERAIAIRDGIPWVGACVCYD